MCTQKKGEDVGMTLKEIVISPVILDSEAAGGGMESPQMTTLLQSKTKFATYVMLGLKLDQS